MTKFVHKPTTMTAVEWDGKVTTVRKMLALGVDFRITNLQSARGQLRVGYVIVNRNRATRIVDLHHYVTKGPDGWPRILTPREMADWEPVSAVPRKPAPVVDTVYEELLTDGVIVEPLAASEPVDRYEALTWPT